MSRARLKRIKGKYRRLLRLYKANKWMINLISRSNNKFRVDWKRRCLRKFLFSPRSKGNKRERGKKREAKAHIVLRFVTWKLYASLVAVSRKLTSAVDFSRVTGVSHFLNGRKAAGNCEHPACGSPEESERQLRDSPWSPIVKSLPVILFKKKVFDVRRRRVKLRFIVRRRDEGGVGRRKMGTRRGAWLLQRGPCTHDALVFTRDFSEHLETLKCNARVEGFTALSNCVNEKNAIAIVLHNRKSPFHEALSALAGTGTGTGRAGGLSMFSRARQFYGPLYFTPPLVYIREPLMRFREIFPSWRRAWR